VGSIARFWLGGLVTRATGGERFPLGTLTVNVVGCLAMGLLAGLAERRHIFDPHTRLFLLTGLLGGFTTFSAFAYESWFLGRERMVFAAFANVLLQCTLGLGAVWLGHWIGTR
jgi:CrcB protein